MIIFGWGRQTFKLIGVVYKNLCSHCHNEDYWVLTRIRTWFTLFFIPIIPYSTKYFLSCPVCKYGATLDSAQVNALKPLAELNQALLDEKITDVEYKESVDRLNKEDSKEIELIEKEVIKTVSKEHFSYCANCGMEVIGEINFCGNCGAAVSIE